MKRKNILVCISLTAALITGVGWVRVDYLNLGTFRIRTDCRVFGVSVCAWESDTQFSKLARELGLISRDNWRRFRSRTLLSRRSPHYVVHSVPHELDFAATIARRLPHVQRVAFVRRVIDKIKHRQFDEIEEVLCSGLSELRRRETRQSIVGDDTGRKVNE